jgi:hypothetical protein
MRGGVVSGSPIADADAQRRSLRFDGELEDGDEEGDAVVGGRTIVNVISALKEEEETGHGKRTEVDEQ